jgi:hypothetical protein
VAEQVGEQVGVDRHRDHLRIGCKRMRLKSFGF